MSKAIVEQVLADHLDLTIVPNGEKFEERRRSMLVPVIDALPGGRSRWGILKKTGGVPSDVVTDLKSATHEHFDVFSGENLGNGTSRITPSWKSNGDYRRRSPHWRRATLDEALAEGWIDPLPGTVEPQPVPVPTPQPTPQPTPTPAPFDRLARVEQMLRAIHDATRP